MPTRTTTHNLHDLMLDVYRNKPVDRIPLGIYIRYLPRGGVERELRERGFGLIDYHPPVSLMAPPWHILPGFLSEVRGVEFSVRHRWQDGVRTERRTFHTPVGDLWQESSQSIGAGSEHISKYYVATLEDYRILQYVVERTVFRSQEEEIRRRIRDLGRDGVLLGRMDRSPYQKLLIELAGAERFLTDLHEYPDVVTELLETMDHRMDEMFRIALDSSVEAIWQPDNITFDLTPPDSFERFCIPFYRRHGPAVRAAGKPYIVHMDGRLRMLEPLVREAPFDVLESLSLPRISGDYGLAEAMDAFPDKVIVPNFPANLSDGTEAEIRDFLRDLLAEARPGRPFMLQVSEDIPEAGWQRTLALLSAFMPMQVDHGR